MGSSRLISRIAEIDWDFSGKLSESPFSRIHWHPCRFASQIPASIIGLLSSPGDVVLDPFCGSGTTLIEAQRLSRNSIGIDLNAISVLISSSKTINISAVSIAKILAEIRDDTLELTEPYLPFLSKRSLALNAICPPSVQSDKWYSKPTFKRLCSIWAMISRYRGRKELIAKAAFSSILLNACNETRHWGYICDNTDPKSSRDVNVFSEFLKVLDLLHAAYKARDLDIRARTGSLKLPASRIVLGDSRSVLKENDLGEIDLVMTSPPYMGVCDYVKAQRLSMEWFGQEIEPSRLLEIGARSKRHRNSARTEYLRDLEDICTSCHRLLRNGKFFVMVFGQSTSRRSFLGSIKSILSDVGFSVVLDQNRRVSSQRRQTPSVRGEHLLICQK